MVTKPKPKPRTVEDWRKIRKKRYSESGKNGGFRILPRMVLDSDAFNELSKSAKLVLILSLDQLDHWHKKKHNGELKRNSTIGALRNDGRFSLPSNLLKERGIKGSDTIAKARKELVAAGFWETVETGSLMQTGIFKWSDNWVTYNQKSFHDRKKIDDDAKPPGQCLYPNIVNYNNRKADKDIKFNENISNLNTNNIQDKQDKGPVQLELFSDLAA